MTVGREQYGAANAMSEQFRRLSERSGSRALALSLRLWTPLTSLRLLTSVGFSPISCCSPPRSWRTQASWMLIELTCRASEGKVKKTSRSRAESEDRRSKVTEAWYFTTAFLGFCARPAGFFYFALATGSTGFGATHRLAGTVMLLLTVLACYARSGQLSQSH